MIKVKKSEMQKIVHLFEHSTDTVVLSCLQGHMGDAYVDNIDSPNGAIIVCDSFVFIEGTKITEDIIGFLKNIHEESRLDKLIIISKVKNINKLLSDGYGTKVTKGERYAIEKKQDEFDLVKLQSLVQNLSPDYQLHKINEELYHECTKEKWTLDFISNFNSAKDFVDRGIGFLITHDNKIISGASSYTIYDEGIEIEIATRKEYRKMGLAGVVGAALILECRKLGLYPSWDAANMMSVNLATKLGYRYLGPYDVYYIEK